MTTSQLIQKFKDTLRGDFMSDQDQEEGSDAVIVAELNLAQNEIAKWSEFTKPALLIQVQAPNYAYALATLCSTNKIRRIIKAWNPTTTVAYKPQSMLALIEQYPTYITDTKVGDPLGLWVDNKTAVFYPTPTASLSLYVHAECDPTPLSAGSLSASSELDDSLHVHIARLAAARTASVNISTAIQSSDIDRMVREAMEAAGNARNDAMVNL